MIRILPYIVFLICYSVYSQSDSDAFYYNTKEKIVDFINAKNDSSKIIINQFISSKNNNYKSFGYVLRSTEYLLDHDLEKFNYNINKSYSLLKNKKDLTSKKIAAYALNIHGVIYALNNQMDKAIYKFNEAKKIAKSIDDIFVLSMLNNNIAQFYLRNGNTEKAIVISYENAKFFNPLYTQYKTSNTSKAIFYTNFGGYYSKLYEKTKLNKYLDSSLTYYRKAILFDKKQQNVSLQINVGIILSIKENYEESKLYYKQAEKIAKENNDLYNLSAVLSNLAKLHYETQKEKQAIQYCEKVDSIYNLNKTDNTQDYIYSNLMQSQIYKKLGNKAKQELHSKICSETTKKYDLKKIADTERVKVILQFIEKEEEYQKKLNQSKNSFFNTKIIFSLFLALFSLLVCYYLYIKYKNNKNVDEFSFSNEKLANPKEFKEIVIDKEQEKRILNKIIELENEKFFLNVDFNQKELAKKINTNTTYLSYVFNKNFNQNFNTHYNDLKINYAIEQINTNKKFREYSTLAIAESVGFKNPDSFTSSFKKKTGKTPFEYIKDFKNT